MTGKRSGQLDSRHTGNPVHPVPGCGRCRWRSRQHGDRRSTECHAAVPIRVDNARPVRPASSWRHPLDLEAVDQGVDHQRTVLLSFIGHFGVDRGGNRTDVPEQYLNGAKVDPVLQQVSGKAVAQGVDVNVLGDTTLLRDQLDGTLNTALVHDHGQSIAFMRWLAAGEQQGGMPVSCPVAAQGLQRQ